MPDAGPTSSSKRERDTRTLFKTQDVSARIKTLLCLSFIFYKNQMMNLIRSSDPPYF